MTHRLRQRLTLTVLTVYWPALFYISHIPVPEGVRISRVSDKGLHLTAYMILSLLLWYSVSPSGRLSWRNKNTWRVLLVIVSYGFLDEILQGLVGRSCDIADFYADMAGTALAMLVFTLFSFWRSLLIITAVAIFIMTNIAKGDIAEQMPYYNKLFHFFGYGFLALLWGCYQRLYFSWSSRTFLWSLSTILIPTVYLAAVKTSSILLERGFGEADACIALAGIAAAAILLLLTNKSRFIAVPKG